MTKFKSKGVFIISERRDESYMEEVNRLESRINFIEREELTHIKEDISEIKCSQVETSTLVKQFIDSSKLQAEAMDSMKIAMYEISSSVKDSNRLSTELTQNVKDLNTSMAVMEEKMDSKFDDVNERINTQENKGKFDIPLYIKCNVIPSLIKWGALGGGAGAILALLGKVGIFQ